MGVDGLLRPDGRRREFLLRSGQFPRSLQQSGHLTATGLHRFQPQFGVFRLVDLLSRGADAIRQGGLPPDELRLPVLVRSDPLGVRGYLLEVDLLLLRLGNQMRESAGFLPLRARERTQPG